MKKLKYLLYGLFLNFVFVCDVYAAPTYKLTVSSSSIENGSKVSATVSVYNTASWNIKITSAGSSSGCSNSWADATSNGANTTKTFTVTCTATSTGSIAFTLSGDITGEDGSNINLSGSKRVTVVARHENSTVNTLKDLSVEGYTLSPEFSADVLEYSVTVPPTTTKVKINATKKDSASTIDGTGEFDVDEGQNKFDIVVTAESGAVRTYTVNVNVEDTNPIKVNVGNEEYSLLKTSRNLEIPSLYTESSMDVDGVNIPIFINEVTNITLVALKNAIGEVNFFIYNDGTYSPYVELSSDTLVIMPTNEEISMSGFKSVSLTLNNFTINAYTYEKEESNYYLFTGKNLITNEDNIYVYNKLDNTYTIFDKSIYNSVLSDYKFAFYFLIGASVTFLLCLLIIILQSSKNKKVQKLIVSLETRLNNEKLNNEKKRLNKKKQDNKKVSSNKKDIKKDIILDNNESKKIENVDNSSNEKISDKDRKSNNIETTEKADALLGNFELEKEDKNNKKKVVENIETSNEKLESDDEKTYNILDD